MTAKNNNISPAQRLWLQYSKKHNIPDNYSITEDDNSLSPEEKDFCGTMLSNIKDTFINDRLRFWTWKNVLFKRIEKVTSKWQLFYRVVVLSSEYDDVSQVLNKILSAVLDQYAPYMKSSWYFNKNVRHYILDNCKVTIDKTKGIYWIVFG